MTDDLRPFRRSGGAARAFRSLAVYNYRVWAAGALVSNIGTWVQRTAQDWLVLTALTRHSASAVGVVMALQFGPQLLFVPWTGYAADRFDRRRLLMTTQAAMGVLALGLGLLTIGGIVRLWHVYLFAFLSGAVSAFDAPARQTFVADLVEERDLANAVALNSTSFNAARMIGPAVAGLCIAVWGTGWSFLGNGVSFLAVLGSLCCMRRRDLRRIVRASPHQGNLVEGLAYIRGRADLQVLLAMLALIGTFGLNFPIFISTMAVTVFHMGPGKYGMLTSAMAIGTTCGALIAARRADTSFKVMVTSAFCFGLGLALAALTPNYWAFAAMLIPVGIAALTFTNSSNSFMQLGSAPVMRGRVMAIRLATVSGVTLVGAPIVGLIADRAGPRWAISLGALSGFVAAAIGHREWRDRRAVGDAAPGVRTARSSPPLADYIKPE